MKAKITLLTVLVSTAPLLAAGPPGAGKFSQIPDRKVQLVAKALGVKLSPGGFSKPYGEALAAFLVDRTDLHKKAALFLAAVDRGASPASVYRLAVASSNISAERAIVGGNKAWPYGSASDEIEFANWLLARAQLQAKAGHHAKAAAWAKAALFASLAAAFPSQNLSLVEMIAWHGKELRSLLGLSAEQSTALSEIVMREKPSAAQKALMSMNLYHDGFLRARRVDRGGLRKLMDLSKVIYKRARPCGIVSEFTVVAVDWQVLNMARAWHEKRAIATIGAYLQHLEKSRRPEIALWARQALREVGPLPLPNLYRAHSAGPAKQNQGGPLR